jgi:hypothetical protein
MSGERDRRRGSVAAVSVALLVAAWSSAPALRAEEGSSPVRVVVETPRPGEVLRGRTDVAPIAGLASADGQPTKFDVVIVVDVSGSTKYPSGIDVDGDGELGETRSSLLPGTPDVPNTDPDDSVLAAETQAATALVDGLDATRVRVGVVSFAGAIDPATGRRRSPDQADAWLEQALTENLEASRQALRAIHLRGASGGTNMEAGIKLALRELAGLSGAQSKPRPWAKKVILLLTDGKPSLPFGLGNKEDPEDIEAVQAAAQLARAAGVTINAYGLGPVAIDYPIAATEMARLTGGLYTPVRRPGDIVAMLSGVSFANIDDVAAVNLTTGDWAGRDDILLQPDGSFKGYVPVRQGRNRIRIAALASDGSRGSAEFDIVFKHQDLTDAELKQELDRIQRRNRELQLLMERKIQAQHREQLQRELELEVENSEEGKP